MKTTNSGKKWLFALALFIIVIMVFSSFLMGMDQSTTSGKYNGHKFAYLNNQWVTTLNNYEMSFYFHPSEVDYLNLTNPENLHAPLIYVTFDPNETNEYIELSRLKLDLAAQSTDTFFSPGVTQPSAEYNFSQVTCRNATPYIPVIFFQKSNLTEIEYNQNCYILKAESNLDFVKLTERIIYQITGVITEEIKNE